MRLKILPLQFQIVNEGQPPSSTGPLFQLPIEILDQILDLLDSEALNIFALVSRDCRQHARTRQLKAVTFNFSSRSNNMARLFGKEAAARKSKDPVSQIQAIGAYVRRITVIDERHMYGPMPESPRSKNRFQQWVRKQKQLRNLQLLITPDVFPHLACFKWQRSELPFDFFENLSRIPVSCLILNQVSITEDKLASFAKPCGLLPLSKLYLDFSTLSRDPQKQIQFLSALNSLLISCASTLESLKWIGGPSHLSGNCVSSDFDGTPLSERLQLDWPADSESINFPKMSTLELEDVDIHPATLLALLDSPIRSLDVCTELEPRFMKIFKNHGKIPSLDSFVWYICGDGYNPSLKFLLSNTQLKKLVLGHPVSSTFVDKLLRFLPSFRDLTSLSVSLIDENFWVDTLDLLGGLKTLTQLHLSAGQLHGASSFESIWYPDHDALRASMSGLSLLRKLAFTRDSWVLPLDKVAAILEKLPSSVFKNDYRVNHVGCGVEYFSTRWPQVAYKTTAAEESDLYRQAYTQMTVAEATKYARVFPSLEWVCFGMVPMTFHRSWKADVQVLPLVMNFDNPAHAVAECIEQVREVFTWGDQFQPGI